MRADPSGRVLGRRDVLIAPLVALVAVAIATYYRSALVPTDPWHYVQGALQFPEPTWRPAGLTRWGFLLPIIPFARLWGDAEATYYAIPLLSTGVLAASLYLLGTRYVARTAGVAGAALALGTPLVFVNLTRGYTDLTATTLVAVSILLATMAADAALDRAEVGVAWGWRVPVLLVACGFTTGWSFEVRETAVFAWPVIGWILLTIRRPLRTLAWFVPPALAWLALDLWLCRAVYGDPLIKLRILGGADISTSVVTSDAGYVGHDRGWYATVMVRSIAELTGGPAILACLVVGLVGGLALRRELGRLWAWGTLTLVLLWAQGGALNPAHPSVRLDVARYWMSFLVPLMLVAAGTGVILLRRTWGGRRVLVAGLAGVLAVGVLGSTVRFATEYEGFAANGGDALGRMRAYLSRSGGVPQGSIWADWGTQRLLEAYESDPFGGPAWSAGDERSLSRLLRVRPADPAQYPQPGDLVVVHSPDDRTCWHCRRALRPVEAAFGPFPAAGWEELMRTPTGNLVLYRLGPDVRWPVAARPAPSGSPDPEDESDDPAAG